MPVVQRKTNPYVAYEQWLTNKKASNEKDIITAYNRILIQDIDGRTISLQPITSSNCTTEIIYAPAQNHSLNCKYTRLDSVSRNRLSNTRLPESTYSIQKAPTENWRSLLDCYEFNQGIDFIWLLFHKLSPTLNKQTYEPIPYTRLLLLEDLIKKMSQPDRNKVALHINNFLNVISLQRVLSFDYSIATQASSTSSLLQKIDTLTISVVGSKKPPYYKQNYFMNHASIKDKALILFAHGLEDPSKTGNELVSEYVQLMPLDILNVIYNSRSEYFLHPLDDVEEWPKPTEFIETHKLAKKLNTLYCKHVKEYSLESNLLLPIVKMHSSTCYHIQHIIVNASTLDLIDAVVKTQANNHFQERLYLYLSYLYEKAITPITKLTASFDAASQAIDTELHSLPSYLKIENEEVFQGHLEKWNDANQITKFIEYIEDIICALHGAKLAVTLMPIKKIESIQSKKKLISFSDTAKDYKKYMTHWNETLEVDGIEVKNKASISLKGSIFYLELIHEKEKLYNRLSKINDSNGFPSIAVPLPSREIGTVNSNAKTSSKLSSEQAGHKRPYNSIEIRSNLSHDHKKARLSNLKKNSNAGSQQNRDATRSKVDHTPLRKNENLPQRANSVNPSTSTKSTVETLSTTLALPLSPQKTHEINQHIVTDPVELMRRVTELEKLSSPEFASNNRFTLSLGQNFHFLYHSSENDSTIGTNSNAHNTTNTNSAISFDEDTVYNNFIGPFPELDTSSLSLDFATQKK